MKVLDSLFVGKENAIQSKPLAKALGFGTVRALQRAIESERAAGAVILSTTQDGGGYYLPSTEQEIHEFVHTLSNRARHTAHAMRSAQNMLDEQTGQTKIGGC